MSLPEVKTLLLEREKSVLTVRLNRPDARNAMSLAMVAELEFVLAAVADDRTIRTVVVRGTGGNFCAGGDIKDMAAARMAQAEGGPDPRKDPIFEVNRAFGRLLERAEAAPQVLVTVCEGAVLGGGFGLACVADVTLVEATAAFGLPETGLGLPPAQIAPYVAKRVGLSQARRLALTGGRLTGREAVAIGLAHEAFDGTEALEAGLATTLASIAKCAPGAIASTKRLLLALGTKPIGELLDEGAREFAACVRGPEGAEGTMAFIQKRKPAWNDAEGGA